jgi:hypothetical protein
VSPGETSPLAGIEVSPFCAHLRSKKLLFQRRPPRDEDELLDASGHTWCNVSQEAAGPDGAVCDPDRCRAGRACFQSYTSGLT